MELLQAFLSVSIELRSGAVDTHRPFSYEECLEPFPSNFLASPITFNTSNKVNCLGIVALWDAFHTKGYQL